MNEEDLGRWCREHGYQPIMFKSARRAILEAHELVFNYYSPSRGGGAANIEPSQSGYVEGVLFGICEDDIYKIDRKEGCPCYYQRSYVTVQLENGSAVSDVVTYKVVEARKGGPHEPTREYMDIVIKGAQKHGLSPGYIRKLSSIRTINEV